MSSPNGMSTAPKQRRNTGQFYSAYKDHLTLLDRIEDLECFALPNLRARYQKQAMLVQLGNGNPRKAETFAQELQAAENDLIILKCRLNSLERYE